MMKRDPSRFLQIGFLVLIFLCVVLVAFWITDNLIYVNTVQDGLRSLPADPSRLTEVIAAIDAASEGRVNRYFWEGAFFLIVLIGGMAVLTRTLRHDAELRRRQQNFLAAVSHEFKSPLASMQLAAETLVMRAKEPDAKRLGQRILEDCERLLRMVDNLLDTTRLEEGRHVMAAEQTDLAAAVTTVVESFTERAARNHIEISQRVPPTAMLSIDRTALDTILRNLVDNALKACIAGNGHNIDIEIDQSDGRVTLAVIDNGLGFSPEDATRMFEKFHRLGDELRRNTPGTGLGLYIVKRLADLSGASVYAQSEGPGNGARISLTWAGRGAS
jgi:signal transduction histidine kinase